MLPLSEIRFDDRRGEGAPAAPVRSGLTVKPPVLRRQTIVIIAVLGIAAIVYGTLVPFNFQRHRPVAWQLQVLPPEPGDALANVLIYVPMGAFLRLLVRRRGSWWFTECALSLLVAGGVSYATEVLQSLLPSRVPTLTDTVCNVLGAAAGVVVAPAFQRWLRLLHAWVYRTSREAPFTAAAGMLAVGLVIYALAPFDVNPTPAHVWAAWDAFQASWDHGLADGYALSPAAVIRKWASAAAYGALAFLLVLAGRESGRGLRRGAWHTLTRLLLLATAVEGMQLFTVSHVADWRDLRIAWICCGAGVMLALAVLWHRPLIYRDPTLLLRTVLPLACPLVLAWAVVSVTHTAGHARGLSGWMPVMGGFHRSWDVVMTEYAAGIVNYLLAAGMIVVWLRLRRRRPGQWACVAGAMVIAATLQVTAALVFKAVPDTGHVILAAVAGAIVHRADRAICGERIRLASGEQAGGNGAGLAFDDSRRKQDGVEPAFSQLGHPNELPYGGGPGLVPGDVHRGDLRVRRV
jgi:VanZ family protein